jgi:hypothetical protein
MRVFSVGSNPTVSAERITFRASSPAATLGERLSKSFRYTPGVMHVYMPFTPEIAQFALGDLTFKVQHPHCTYSSMLAKELWDIGKAILILVLMCPVSASMSQLSCPLSSTFFELTLIMSRINVL